MLDRQLPAYEAQARFASLLLGLISWSDRLTAATSVARSDGKAAAPCALSDFLLGVIAASRTLRRSLSAGDGATPAPPPETSETPPLADRTLLR